MKKVIAAVLAFVAAMSLAGCSMSQTTEIPTETSNPSQEYHDSLTATADDVVLPDNPGEPTNYMDEIKAEIHDELFRKETPETLDIVDRIFKHLEVETVTSKVEGDEAQVLMNITTINAGKAWIIGLEKYAILCAENLFSDEYVDDATLYSCYLEEFEDSVRKAEYIKTPVTVEMDYKNHRWVWDIDDDVINAITGFLLAAIEGDINSDTFAISDLVDEEVKDFGVAPEVEEVTPSEDISSDMVEILGYEISDYHGKSILCVIGSYTNTSNETQAQYEAMNERAFQNGVELNKVYYVNNEKLEELYSNSGLELRPGVSIEFAILFELKSEDLSAIEVEFYEWNGWEETILAYSDFSS